MKTLFKFKSADFPEYVDREDSIRPGLYGRRLAEFMSTKLAGAGYRVLGIFPEPDGWIVELENANFPLRVACCSFIDAPGTYICAIDPAKAFVRLWFERIPTMEIVGPLGDAVEKILVQVTLDLQVR